MYVRMRTANLFWQYCEHYFTDYPLLVLFSMIKRLRNSMSICIILLFSVVIYSLTNERGLYMPLVYFMYVSPLFFLFFVYSHFKADELYLWTILPLLFMQYFLNKESFRISTVLYSSLFILVFILYKRLIILKSLSIFQYRKILVVILNAYFVVLVLQQAGVIFHFPVVNKNWTSDSFKLNSLSYEASYVAATLPLLMYSIIKVDERIVNRPFGLFYHIKRKPKLWFVFLYTVFTCGATTVFFTVPVFIFYFFRRRVRLSTIIGILLLLVVGFLLIEYFNPKLLERQAKLIPAMSSFDSRKLIETDVSAATRIVPFMLFFEKVINLDFKLVLGYGIDYSQKLYSLTILGDNERETGSLGIVAFLLDYGLIPSVLFIIAIVKYTSQKFLSYENLFFFTCFFVFGFNHYLTWMYMILMFTNRFFVKQGVLNLAK